MFELTEDQQLLKQNVREFMEKNVEPTVLERDAAQKWDRSLYDQAAELGLTGLYLPEEYGGSGIDFLSYIMAVEEISRVDDGLGIALSASVSLCSNPINDFGTPEQKEKYLTPLAKGEHLGAFGLTEPNAGSDAARQQSIARLEGDHYVLNGSKIFITNASSAETYVVFAMTDPSAGTRGITGFILEKDMPGFTFGKKENKLGIRTSLTRELLFQDVKVPVENVLGQVGKGFKVAMATLDGGRIAVAAQAVGIAQGAYEHALAYAKERVQFNAPIAKNQTIGFKLADMATKIDAARLLTYRAASLKDAGKPFSKEAAMAKYYASDIALEVTADAIQIYGGYGYSEDYPVARYFRNAKITQIYEGTNEIQRVVVSGSILR
ncbi:acyl-CoA dehydrogenase [Propionimicrobium sp. PCR01-08-3]|nr:acyl-CoA dehydrogenase [Propionimicrobium sp. PCR01-08-3]WIY81560.1 acyl-CoA dehydrogenase [Propionimicrobium sp. PCR01-08-3]